MPQKEAPTGVTILRENKTLMIGMIAFICAIVNLLFGLFLNLSTDLLAYFAEHTATHWMVVLLMFSVVLFSFAVLSGIFSIIFYTKSKKTTLDAVGFTLSILSFVVGCSGLILNIVALIIW